LKSLVNNSCSAKATESRRAGSKKFTILAGAYFLFPLHEATSISISARAMVILQGYSAALIMGHPLYLEPVQLYPDSSALTIWQSGRIADEKENCDQFSHSIH